MKKKFEKPRLHHGILYGALQGSIFALYLDAHALGVVEYVELFDPDDSTADAAVFEADRGDPFGESLDEIDVTVPSKARIRTTRVS